MDERYYLIPLKVQKRSYTKPLYLRDTNKDGNVLNLIRGIIFVSVKFYVVYCNTFSNQNIQHTENKLCFIQAV